MFQSLFVAADSMPDPFLWIGAGVLVVAVIGLQFGRDTAIMVGGILAAAGAVALGAWLVAAWYAAAPQFVAGLAVGSVVWLTAGGIVTLGVWAFAGPRVAAWVGGLLGGAAVVAWAIYVVAAWYAADPRFVIGIAVGLLGGFLVGSGLLIFTEARRAPYGED